jgi:hypothetical protein
MMMMMMLRLFFLDVLGSRFRGLVDNGLLLHRGWF